MTIQEAIGQVDSIRKNTYSVTDKIQWLSNLDSLVKNTVIDTHDGGENVVFTGYTDEDMDTELLIPAPYDTAYLRWIDAQISYHDGELSRYNEAITIYNMLLQSFQNDYNRKHMPLDCRIRYF